MGSGCTSSRRAWRPGSRRRAAPAPRRPWEDRSRVPCPPGRSASPGGYPSADERRTEGIAQVLRVGEGRGATVAPAVDATGEAARLSFDRRLDVLSIDPDRRRADELLTPGRLLGVDFAYLGRAPVQPRFLHRVTHHRECPLPRRAFAPPQK